MTEDTDPGPSSRGSNVLESLIADCLARRSLGEAGALDDLCARHPEHAGTLRQRLAEIEALGLASKQLTQSAKEPVCTASPAERLARLHEQAPTASARYEVVGELGRGGMGIVLRVRDVGLGRSLAMKVVLDGREHGAPAVDPDVLQRFLDEAQITGQLDHPGVVPVHELGVDGGGRPFFTMRLVRGATADSVFRAARAGEDGWTRTRALEVLLKICDTMAFAHSKGVLHRDLKPSNVMVGRYGEVYVMDWGLARVMTQPDPRDLRPRPPGSTVSRVATERSREAAGSDSPVVTMDGAVVGTPSYMPPEQAEGRSEEMDPRADVYAVGAMLYQLLTGWQPYVRPGARVSPYTVLAAVQAGPPAPVHTIDKAAPAELVAICDKAMARALDRRYPDMRALADDLRAHLETRVVKAHRTGPVAELALWVRRNRPLAAALAAAILALVGGIAGMGWFASEAGEQRRAATDLADARKAQLEQASWTAFHQADRLFADAYAAATDEPQDEALRIRNVGEGLLQLARAIAFDPANAIARQRLGWEAMAWGKRIRRTPLATAALQDVVGEVVWSPEGQRLLAACQDGKVRIVSARTGRVLVTMDHGAGVEGAVFDGEGRRVLSFGGDRPARIWSALDGVELASIPDTGVGHAAILPDGAHVVLVGQTTARVHAIGSGDVGRDIRHPRGAQRVLLCSDGRHVVTTGQGDARLWDASDGRARATLVGSGRPEHVAMSLDGKLAAAVYDEGQLGQVMIWNADSGMLVASSAGVGPAPKHRPEVAFSPDGTRLVVGSKDGAMLLDAITGKVLANVREGEVVCRASFSPDGRWIVTSSRSGTRIRDAASGETATTFPSGDTYRATFSPDGAHISMRPWSREGVRIFSVVGGRPVARLEYRPTMSRDQPTMGRAGGPLLDGTNWWDLERLRRRRLEPTDQLLCAGLADEGVRVVVRDPGNEALTVCDGLDGRALATLSAGGSVQFAALHVDGTRLITLDDARTLKLWNVTERSLLATRQLRLYHQLFFDRVARRVLVIGPDVHVGGIPGDERGVTGHRDVEAAVIDLVTGTVVASFAHRDNATAAAFHPDGHRLLVATADGARCIDLTDTDTRTVTSFPHGARVDHVAFSGDGRRCATAGFDADVKIWSDDGRPIASLGQDALPVAVALDHDGALALTSVWLGNQILTRIWSVDRGKVLANVVHPQRCSPRGATFTPDGRWACPSDASAVLPVDLEAFLAPGREPWPQMVEDCRALAELLAGRMLSLDGELMPLPEARRDADLARVHSLPERCPPLAAIAHWIFSSDLDERAYPGSAVTRRERVDSLLDAGGWTSVEDAHDLAPGDPLVHIALAAHERGVVGGAPAPTAAETEAAERALAARATFLREYGLSRLPADAAVCARAAEMLLAQGDKPRALRAAEKALALDPTNEQARRTQAAAR